jgi:hypothetical protein
VRVSNVRKRPSEVVFGQFFAFRGPGQAES